MLKLDPKKVRKGKPIGLPYPGSKKKISKKIVEIIKQNFGSEKTVYDLFGGGGAVSIECALNGIDVVYNDYDKNIVNALKRSFELNREQLKNLVVSRERFLEIRDKQAYTADDVLILLVNSFGNNCKDYLYSKESSDFKFNVAKKIMFDDDIIGGYKKSPSYLNLKECVRIQQLERLNVLQRIQNVSQVNRVSQHRILTNHIKNLSYDCYRELSGKIIYLDPPYENAKQPYLLKHTFDSQKLYDWAYEMSKNNIVIMSSYHIYDDRFKCVYEFSNAHSSYAGGSDKSRVERLFMARS